MSVAPAEDGEPGDERPLVPLGWKPTRDQPVPVVRCTRILESGERCARWSLRGATVCIKHGAQLAGVRAHAEAVVESARLRLIGNTDQAVDVLEQLMQPGTSENVRLKAAESVLDRSGIRGGVDIHTETEITVNPSELLTQRLEQLRRRSIEARERLSDVFGGDIIEGELVDESTHPEVDQPSLFDMPDPADTAAPDLHGDTAN